MNEAELNREMYPGELCEQCLNIIVYLAQKVLCRYCVQPFHQECLEEHEEECDEDMFNEDVSVGADK